MCSANQPEGPGKIPALLFSAAKQETPRLPLQTVADRERLRRFKHLTEVALPARAAAHRWPIRLDHCFKRICLDHAFADVWYNHLARPAERHLTGEPLQRALLCAEGLLEGELPLLRSLNQASLDYRGKSGAPGKRPPRA